MHVPLRRVLPAADSTEIDLADAYAAPLGSHEDRPWVGLCMVASIDGSTVVDGVSAGLSSPNDSGVLIQLRSIADVIVVGAGTVRGEGYGVPKRPGQRIGVVTNSGSIDPTTALFESGAGFLISSEATELDSRIERDLDVIRVGARSVDLRGAFAHIPQLCPDVSFIQVEGGATLNAAIAAADLFDELNVTTSPATVGGSGPRLFHGGVDHTRRYELAQMLVDDESFVFSRWARREAPTSP
ncbi:dihydrofolate reductase family protein [Ilumatobacter nonamiensis]|uniref:dihydrofolate reductase family protein n=1 Tax=Ilumatobacter nonamiensis TaxID=467093 RepID=UPI0003481AEE|nr:dihydrofolate reductase family protein [Ilumatobacter nonamiensis]